MPSLIKIQYPEAKICEHQQEYCLCKSCLRARTPFLYNKCPKPELERCRGEECALGKCPHYVKLVALTNIESSKDVWDECRAFDKPKK